MGKNPIPTRTNRTRTQVLPRTEPNQKVKMYKNPNRTLLRKSRTEPEPHVYRTRSEPEPIFKVLRTRTEPNTYHQRTGTETRAQHFGYFPISNIFMSFILESIRLYNPTIVTM